MRRLLLFAALACALAAPLHAQTPTPDTVAWRRYFPLAVGNVWEYVHYESGVSFQRLWKERYEVVRRTIAGADTLYTLHSYQSDSLTARVLRDTLTVRYDDTTAAVVDVRTRQPALFPFGCGLDASGSGWWQKRWCSVFVHPLDRYPGYDPWPGRIGKYLANYVYGGLWIADLGMVEGGGGCEPCNAFSYSQGWTLRYARIGGVEYGQRVVSRETDDRPVAETALRLWPNPTRGAATVQATPGAEVVAVDLLGREAIRVRADASGRAALTLVPGWYVVRAGGQRQTLVVR